MKKTVVLMILDGWGRGIKHPSNAIYQANPKSIDYIEHNFLSGSLQSSGISVGLPWGEEGNSEVGHLTMGIGRVIYQYYPRISLSIRNGSFFKNSTIEEMFDNAIQNKSKINFVGLISVANVHSSLEHLNALIKLAEEKKVDYSLHLFTDGRDSDPKSAYQVLSKLPQDKIGSLSGRYYGMDRDKHWNLTKSSYDAMVGAGMKIKKEEIQKHLSDTYDKNLNDEYIPPISIEPEKNSIKDNDSIFFFNFREDRMRQISAAFVEKIFNEFPIKKLSNIKVGSMTKIEEHYEIPVAFQPKKITNSLGKVLSDNNKVQIRIAETQKYAHVTFFFNGLRDKPFKNEYRILIPSMKVTRLEEYPQMRAKEITDRVIESMRDKAFDFILVNYANPDMLAHTGDLNATIKGIQFLDSQVMKVLNAAFKIGDVEIIVTSDHGNAERLYNPETGEIETKHDANPVPIYLVGKKFYRKMSDKEIEQRKNTTIGLLSDIAPTVLELMGIPKPDEMDGESLLSQLLA